MNVVTKSDLQVKKCGVEVLGQVLELQERVIAGLEDKSLLRANTEAMFLTCLQEPHLTLGVFAGEELVALSILYVPDGDEEDLSKDLENISVERSANYKLALVDESYRGLGLQKGMLWLLERWAYRKGYTDLCTTVAPDNHFSMTNVLKAGYRKDHETEKYGGLKRAILCKHISSEQAAYEQSIEKAVSGMMQAPPGSLGEFDGDLYLKGELELVTNGDILEYEDECTGERILCICLPEQKVYIPAWNKVMPLQIWGNQLCLKQVYLRMS